MSDDVDIMVLEIGTEETPLAIVFHSTPAGGYAVEVKGRMDPLQLSTALRAIADDIDGRYERNPES
jgi:hypothetical protein